MHDVARYVWLVWVKADLMIATKMLTSCLRVSNNTKVLKISGWTLERDWELD